MRSPALRARGFPFHDRADAMAGVANLPSTGWTPEEPCPLEWRFQEEGRFLVWQTEPYFSLHAEDLHRVRCQVDCRSHSNDTDDGSETNAFSASVHDALSMIVLGTNLPIYSESCTGK